MWQQELKHSRQSAFLDLHHHAFKYWEVTFFLTDVFSPFSSAEKTLCWSLVLTCWHWYEMMVYDEVSDDTDYAFKTFSPDQSTWLFLDS